MELAVARRVETRGSGTDPADPVEATIRVLMREAHNARNMDL
jgi:hypothetical protein